MAWPKLKIIVVSVFKIGLPISLSYDLTPSFFSLFFFFLYKVRPKVKIYRVMYYKYRHHKKDNTYKFYKDNIKVILTPMKSKVKGIYLIVLKWIGKA